MDYSCFQRGQRGGRPVFEVKGAGGAGHGICQAIGWVQVTDTLSAELMRLTAPPCDRECLIFMRLSVYHLDGNGLIAQVLTHIRRVQNPQ